MKRFHSVTLDMERCLGCTNCIKRCPTEAIRVRDGKAKIIDERCIDCGECIRICPQHAKLAITDSLEDINKYKYPVAVPAPTLFSQFKGDVTPDKILSGLLKLGFVRVYEVARAAEIVSQATVQYIKNRNTAKPIISSACPAVVRLIAVRFPELVDNILPLDSPMEIAGRMLKQEMKEEGCNLDDVGVFFISPCAAKYTAVTNPIGREKCSVDGVIAISDIYGPLYNVLKKMKDDVQGLQKSSGVGINWAVTGGETKVLPAHKYLTVDGLNNVAKVLEDVVMGKLKEVEFIEGLACVGGCVGGPLTIENPFMAKTRIQLLAEKYGCNLPEMPEGVCWEDLIWEKRIHPRSVMKLDEDMVLAMQKMEALDEIHQSLPGLDCGACGAPTCRALAEDIVRNQADEIDCIFKLRENVKELAESMVELASKMPPSIGEKNTG